MLRSINFFSLLNILSKFPNKHQKLHPKLPLNRTLSKTVVWQNLRFPWYLNYKKYMIFLLVRRVTLPQITTIDSQFNIKNEKNYKFVQIGGPHLCSPLPPSLECRLRGAESPQSSHPYRFHLLGDSTYLSKQIEPLIFFLVVKRQNFNILLLKLLKVTLHHIINSKIRSYFLLT